MDWNTIILKNTPMAAAVKRKICKYCADLATSARKSWRNSRDFLARSILWFFQCQHLALGIGTVDDVVGEDVAGKYLA